MPPLLLGGGGMFFWGPLSPFRTLRAVPFGGKVGEFFGGGEEGFWSFCPGKRTAVIGSELENQGDSLRHQRPAPTKEGLARFDLLRRGRQGKAGSPGFYSLSHGVAINCGWHDSFSRGGNRARSGNGANNAPFLSSQAAKSPPGSLHESACSPPRRRLQYGILQIQEAFTRPQGGAEERAPAKILRSKRFVGKGDAGVNGVGMTLGIPRITRLAATREARKNGKPRHLLPQSRCRLTAERRDSSLKKAPTIWNSTK